MPKIELTVHDIKTIACALVYCQVDAEDSRDNATGDTVKEYYSRKAKMYAEAWQALYAALERAGENAGEIIIP